MYNGDDDDGGDDSDDGDDVGDQWRWDYDDYVDDDVVMMVLMNVNVHTASFGPLTIASTSPSSASSSSSSFSGLITKNGKTNNHKKNTKDKKKKRIHEIIQKKINHVHFPPAKFFGEGVAFSNFSWHVMHTS